MGKLASGDILPADSYRSRWALCSLQHLCEQLHPGSPAMRTVVQLEHHCERGQLHQLSQHYTFQNGYKHGEVNEIVYSLQIEKSPISFPLDSLK